MTSAAKLLRAVSSMRPLSEVGRVSCALELAPAEKLPWATRLRRGLLHGRKHVMGRTVLGSGGQDLVRSLPVFARHLVF
jgi:hypothetical protein